MASSASTVLRQELMAATENDGTWGPKANINFGILENAAGAGETLTTSTGGTVTLTNVDYTNDQAKKRNIRANGTLSSNLIIVVPNAVKTYMVINATSGAYTMTIKTSSGTAIAITQGTACEVHCDGSNVMSYTTPMVVTGTGAPSSASGAAASAVSVTPSGNLAATNAQAALSELQSDIDNRQPLDSDLTAIAALTPTKGNLMAGNGTNWAAFTVGTNGTIPVADSGQTLGVAWATIAAALGLTTRGDILTMGAAAAQRVALGTSGHVVQSNGTDTVFGQLALAAFADGIITYAKLASAATATQAQMETATATDVIVTPGRQHNHPGHPKCWGMVTVSGGTPTLTTSYNMTSITDTGQGDLTATIATDFSSANWACQATFRRTAASSPQTVGVASAGQAAGTVELLAVNFSGTALDPEAWYFVGHGDHA